MLRPESLSIERLSSSILERRIGCIDGPLSLLRLVPVEWLYGRSGLRDVATIVLLTASVGLELLGRRTDASRGGRPDGRHRHTPRSSTDRYRRVKRVLAEDGHR